MSTLDAGAIKAIMHGTIKIPPEGVTVRRFLACGGREGRDLAAAMNAARIAAGHGTWDTLAEGTVEDGPGPEVVEVLDAQDQPLTRCDVDKAGQFRCPVPNDAERLAAGWLGDGGPGLQSGGQPGSGPAVGLAASGPHFLKGPAPTELRIDATRNDKPLTVRVTLRPTDADPDKLRRRTFINVDGLASHQVPAGAYEVWLTAGPLSSMHHEKIQLIAGQTVTVKASLAQVVKAPGWIAADLHTHAEPSSDSSVPVATRVAGAVAEDLDYVVATDHDVTTDYRRWIEHSELLSPGKGGCIRVGEAGGRLLTAVGQEISTLKTGHFNVWPLKAGPEGALGWYQLGPKALLDALHGSEADRVVQCNHPRFESFSYFKTIKFDVAKTDKALLRCDLMEVVNGLSHKETAQVLIDWLGLLNRGIRITATGVSDCHESADAIGNVRTWVYLGEAATAGLCEGGAAVVDKALMAGRAVASGGPMVTMKVSRAKSVAQIGDLLPAEPGPASVHVQVAAPEWLPLGTVEIYAGGAKIASEPVGATEVKAGARVADVAVPLPESATDTTVVAVHVPSPGGGGWPGIQSPAWAVTNPVFIDGDGDGKWFGQSAP